VAAACRDLDLANIFKDRDSQKNEAMGVNDGLGEGEALYALRIAALNLF
jgi:hypothetical protein